MPQMKAHSGATKRVKVTGRGKLRRRQINMNHILGKMPSKRKRRLNRETTFASGDEARVKRMLGRR